MASLSKRMKSYEKTINYILPPNLPIIIRIDGRSFHTFTEDLDKPFDFNFISMMNAIGIALCNEITGCRFAYLQSDEISLLVYKESIEESWFKNKFYKISSISASLASATAMKWKYENNFKKDSIVSFDSRAYVIPYDDVINYFIWRQNDWERNSLNMLARKYFSQKELIGKKKSELHELIHKAGDNWAKLPIYIKRGRTIIKTEISKYVENPYYKGEVIRNKWIIDEKIPIFTENRGYILSELSKIESKETE
ncbi:MAG: tRNA(His) guanylyltransferase Thg1 family protein [Candidatus Lokiarchaeota archaeon]|nr:tRNA(His) guanylyltransferase Thg1 family protein [Candidatus Lokiarchaeota archaeon]